MKRVQKRVALPFLLLVSVFLTPVTLSPASLSDIDALAPLELVAEGFKEPTGVVVDQNGAIFVSDRKSGEVLQVNAGVVYSLITHLQRPVGLSFDAEGRLLIVEEKTGLLLRLETSGVLTVLVQGMRKPRWLTVAEDKNIYISAKGLGLENGDDEDEEQGEVILRLTPDLVLTVFATGFKGLQGLVVHKSTLLAAAKGLKNEDDEHGAVFRIPIQPDGAAGPITWLTQGEIKKPMGLALDALGALYVSAEEIELEKKAKDAIGKVPSAGTITRFASELKKPRGMAFDSFGNLYVADDKGDENGRILRFRAPPPPTLIAPSPFPFTNRSPLPVGGTAEPNSRIDRFLNSVSLPFTISDEAGNFFFKLDLAPNDENSLTLFTTSHLGRGLTSAPAEFTIVHDDIPPGVAFIQPPAGGHVRQTVGVEVQANDGGSSIASFSMSVDGQPLPASLSPQPPASSVVATATWNTTTVSDGSHELGATATDQAGNVTTVTRMVFVDNTPPDTQIPGGPEGTISATSAVFMIGGSDNLTPTGSLVFSWRLDSGPFSAFSSQTQVSFTGLTPGPHTFEVKARDLAGNEDPTPATRAFTISTLQVLITEPIDGATVNAGNLLVRGTVEAGGQEVGVNVNGIPAFVNGTQWVAELFLTPGSHPITATATTITGAQATTAVTVNASQVAAGVLLRSLPVSGAVPLTVKWEIANQTGRSLVQFEFDDTGAGTFGPPSTSFSGVETTYTTAGVFFPTLRATDDQGMTYVATTIVNVENPQAVAKRFQNLWTGFKDRLGSGNIPGALAYLAPTLRPRFETVFQQLGANLPGVVASFGNLEVLEQSGDLAETVIVQQENGAPMVYFVYFRRDSLGRWLIEEM